MKRRRKNVNGNRHPKWDPPFRREQNLVCLKSHCLYDTESVCPFIERMVFCESGIMCNCHRAHHFIRYEDDEQKERFLLEEAMQELADEEQG